MVVHEMQNFQADAPTDDATLTADEERREVFASALLLKWLFEHARERAAMGTATTAEKTHEQ